MGNQEFALGNPLGYHRTTQQSKWNDASQRYEAWKSYVQGCYNDAGLPFENPIEEKPLTTSAENPMRMDIEIEFSSDGRRPDPDNVFKGIADALFKNDKHLMAGSFVSKISPDKVGSVKVIIKKI